MHRDLEKLCKADPVRNRRPDFTTENLFCAVLVMQIEGLPYREVTIRIAESVATSAITRRFKTFAA